MQGYKSCPSPGVAVKSEVTCERGPNDQATRLPFRTAVHRWQPHAVQSNAVDAAGFAKGDNIDHVAPLLQLQPEPEKSSDALHADESCPSQPPSALPMLRMTRYSMMTSLRTGPVTLHIQTVQFVVTQGHLVILIRSLWALLIEQKLEPKRIPRSDNSIITFCWHALKCCRLVKRGTAGCLQARFVHVVSFNLGRPPASSLKAQPWLVDCSTTRNMVERTADSSSGEYINAAGSDSNSGPTAEGDRDHNTHADVAWADEGPNVPYNLRPTYRHFALRLAGAVCETLRRHGNRRPEIHILRHPPGNWRTSAHRRGSEVGSPIALRALWVHECSPAPTTLCYCHLAHCVPRRNHPEGE